MASYRWPSTDRHRPENAIEHATYLKAEFDSVSNAANASLSHATLLPSGLESRISIGITKGIAEARSKRCCPKLSEIDKSIFSKVMLKNITAEAALESRDRVPLPQFNGLHESYNALHTKLVTQMPPAAATHQFIGVGAATEATSVIDLVSAAKKTSEETNNAPTSLGVPTNRQEEEAEDIDDEESGEDTNEEEEDEMDESEDAEIDQEVMGNRDNASGDDSSEKGSSDDASGSEESSETDSDASSEEVGDQEVVREMNVPNIKGDGRSFSTTVNLKIEQQASVNRLEEMTAPELSSYLSRSLKNLLHEQQLSSKISHISGISLLDNGDLRVDMHAESREALQRIVDSADWGQKLEKALVCWQVPTYKVRMHSMAINRLNFQSRKEKAAIIRQLAGDNHAIGQASDKIIIRDIRWSHNTLPVVYSSLIVDFLDPEQATQALHRGLCWQGSRHGCERADNYRVDRCTRCQGYGHLWRKCSKLRPRCGKCAEQHETRTCTSNKVKCASCGGDHHAGKRTCPVRVNARKCLGFVKETASQAVEPAAEAPPAQATAPTPVRNSISAARTQTETSMPSPVSLDANATEDEVKSEHDRSLPQVDPTQDVYPDTATLLKKIEDLRKIVVARDSALQSTSSGRTKRRAGEAFAGGAEAESSNMAAKRIKQEPSAREDSMGLYRQPSPFIVNRPQ